MEQIKKDSAAWRAKIAAAETQKHNSQTQIDAALRSIDATAAGIDALLQRYHSLLLELRLFPAESPLARGSDLRVRLEHVEDGASVSSRDASQYQRQISGSAVLGRMEVVAERTDERRRFWRSIAAAWSARRWRCASRSCGWRCARKRAWSVGEGGAAARGGGKRGGGERGARGESREAARGARRDAGSAAAGECGA